MNGNFIITGAAQGFGREFTERVLKSGGKVVLADKNVEVGKQTHKELSEQFGAKNCLFVALDVTDRENWRQMWQQVDLSTLIRILKELHQKQIFFWIYFRIRNHKET